MKCRDCRFFRNDGDGFGECITDKHGFVELGTEREHGYDTLLAVVDIGKLPMSHWLRFGADYGCIHAEATEPLGYLQNASGSLVSIKAIAESWAESIMRPEAAEKCVPRETEPSKEQVP